MENSTVQFSLDNDREKAIQDIIREVNAALLE
ncbi:MAG: IreB family regulatory phosphoprotein, partial [Eubacteriaceae bacterium]|nr:IreB family regulatory phosphoprotein [Eubacteriaceae bacterium]